MADFSLTLYPYGRQPFSVAISEKDLRKRDAAKIITKSSDIYVFSDLSYEFTLSCDDALLIQDVRVYINDIYEPSVYNDGHIRFPDRQTSDRRIFIDCYGFVEIDIDVFDTDGNEHQYSTEYIPVLVRRGELNEAVKSMVNFVYSNQENLLLNGEPQAKSLASIKENGYQNLSTQIILAEEIATLYESNYGYFKANSRFKIEKVPQMDRFEHLQYVTPATVRFITTHPEELRQNSGSIGIRVGRLNYQPEKTLSLRNEYSYDIYENRVVLGFIQKMIESTRELCTRCSSLLNQIPNSEDYNSEYIYSSYFMFSETRKILENSKARLEILLTKFAYLWTIYNDILNVHPEPMLNEPHASFVFVSIPQYNRVFIKIHEWFHFGIYDFSKEKFMLSFIKLSSLYERYLLVKMIAYFQNRGYTYLDARRCVYPTRNNWKYKNTNCDNTFVFQLNKRKLTLYYQPVIYDTDESAINGIGLMRNNSIATTTVTGDINRTGSHYYSPDYLIKVEDDSVARYVILDAKFSDYMSVRRYHIKELAFKYLFSISTVRSAESIVGLCLIYGKCEASERLRSAYDKQLPNQQIKPIAELLPIMENAGSNEHYRKLDALMRMIVI